jgi:hypothetical protein
METIFPCIVKFVSLIFAKKSAKNTSFCSYEELVK